MSGAADPQKAWLQRVLTTRDSRIRLASPERRAERQGDATGRTSKPPSQATVTPLAPPSRAPNAPNVEHWSRPISPCRPSFNSGEWRRRVEPRA
jgi:hypothetical protein